MVPTFREAVQSWIDVAKGEWSPRSRDNVDCLLTGWLSAFGKYRVDQIGIREMGHFYNLRAQTPTRKGKLRLPQTLNDERGYLQRAWKYFILQGWAKLDPVVVWPRREKVVNDDYPQELTREEEAVLWGCMDDPLYRGILKPAVTVA